MTIRIREMPLEELSSVMESDWADTTRKPYVSGETAYVPVREGYVSTGNLAPRQRYRGRGYQMIGPIAVVRGERPTPEEVKQIVDWQHPRGVLWVSLAFRGLPDPGNRGPVRQHRGCHSQGIGDLLLHRSFKGNVFAG